MPVQTKMKILKIGISSTRQLVLVEDIPSFLHYDIITAENSISSTTTAQSLNNATVPIYLVEFELHSVRVCVCV